MTVNEQITHHIYSQLNVTYQAGLLKHSVNRLLAYMLWVEPGPLCILQEAIISNPMCLIAHFSTFYILEDCIEPRELHILESLCKPNFVPNI